VARYVTRDIKKYNVILKDSPIYIEKSRILYDTETEDLLFQVSFRNIDDEDIKLVCFRATTYDEEGKILKKNVPIKIVGKFIGLESHSNKEPIIIEDKKTTDIKLVIDYVVYYDDSKWVNNGKREGSILKTKKYIDNYEFTKALKYKNIKVSLNNYPIFTEDYYICSCGKLNKITNKHCIECGHSKEEIQNLFDEENVKQLIEEYHKQEEEDKKKYEEELEEKYQQLSKKIKKTFKILLVITLILGLCTSIFILIKNNLFYNNGLKYYNDKKYEKSIETLNKIKTKKSKKLLNDVYYEYGVYLKDNNNCEQAVLYLKKTTKDINHDVIDSCYIILGDSSTENKKYIDAIDYYKKVKNKDIEDKINDAYYYYGIELYNIKDYVGAIHYFEKCQNYKDSDEWLNKSKVGYIEENPNIYNDKTNKYIHELLDAKYEGSQELYNEITKWKAKIYASKYKTDTEGSSSLSRYSSIYFHVKVTGGDRDEEITLKYKVIYPDGEVSEIDTFKNKYSDGDTGYVYWADGLYGTIAGNLTLIFYEGSTMEEIGRHTIRIY